MRPERRSAVPLGDESSNTLIIEVAGTALASDLVATMIAGYVDHRSNVPDMFILDFTDSDNTLLSKASIKVGTAMRLSVQQTGPASPVLLLSGEVTTLEKEVGAGGVHTVIRGFDHSHRLFRGKRVVAYVDSTAGDIVKTVASRAGLKNGQIASDGPVFSHVSQDGVNDWDFLSRLAGQAGASLAVVEGAVNFGPPTDASTAPNGAAGSGANPLILQQGKNLLYLKATVTSADQVPDVELRGWSVENKQELISIAPSATTSADLPTVKPSDLATHFNSPRYVAQGMAFEQQSQYDAAAKALASSLAGAFAELEGTIRGNPTIRPGAAVTLTGLGAPFEGRYTVTSSHHDFSSHSGYVTDFTVSSKSDRSLYGVSAGGADATSRLPGVVVGIVTATKDPQNLGRVKVKFPQLSDDYESSWARTVQAGAGSGRGAVILPEVGDEVLVAFEYGSFDWPCVLGGMYNGVDAPDKPWNQQIDDTDGSITRRAFTSRTGMVVEFIETPSNEQLTISTSSGAQKITLTQNQQQGIEMASEGPLAVTAKGDISITTSSGDVTLKGNNVSIEATMDLQLKGATATLSGTESAEVTAASVKVTGQASAQLSASGTVIVQGSMVQIN
jgi:uncharacterized protein involved in type VI secretion and phage assembly